MGGIEEQWDRILRWIGCPSFAVDSMTFSFSNSNQMQIIVLYMALLIIFLLITNRLSVDEHRQMHLDHQKLQIQKARVSSTSQRNAFKSVSSSSQTDASSHQTAVSSSTQTDASSSSWSNLAASTPSYKLKMKQPMLTSKSSQSSESFCNICMDTKSPTEIFTNATVCSHQYCSDCICRHISTKIKENITKVKCPDPDCKGVIGPEHCRSFVPKQVLERWEDALCESLILGTQKFYCPFRDCSAMLVDDGGETVTSSECPNCNRLFCAQCKVPWHSGLDCREYKSLKEHERNPDDMMLMELAKKKKWKRCPSCNHVVEKLDGCNSISCRCGYAFCYGCGKKHFGLCNMWWFW